MENNKICLFAKSRTSFTGANSDYSNDLKAYITLLFFGGIAEMRCSFFMPENCTNIARNLHDYFIELMEAIQVLAPNLYDAILNKLNNI